jgi:group I intron endonuclease
MKNATQLNTVTKEGKLTLFYFYSKGVKMILNDFIQGIPTKAGVYQFYVYSLDKYYIGESVNIRRRLLEHLTGNGKEEIYKAYCKNGLDDLGFQILCFEEDREKRCIKEQFFKEFYGRSKILNKTVANEFYFDPGNYRHRKRVMEFDLQGNHLRTWESAKQASLSKGGVLQSITQAARNERISMYGKIWIYEKEFTKDKLDQLVIDCKKLKRNRKIRCLDLNNNLVEVFSNIEQACKRTKSLPCKISACCRGIRKTHNNYKWEYVNE